MQFMTSKEEQVQTEMVGVKFSPRWKDVQLYRGQIRRKARIRRKKKKISFLFQNCALSIPKWSESIAVLGLLWLEFPEISSMPLCQADCAAKRVKGHTPPQK